MPKQVACSFFCIRVMHRPIGRLFCKGGGEVHSNDETDERMPQAEVSFGNVFIIFIIPFFIQYKSE